MGEALRFKPKPEQLCCEDCDSIVFHWYSDNTLVCVMCGAEYDSHFVIDETYGKP